MRGTAILDLDGTLLENLGKGMSEQLAQWPKVLPGARTLIDRLHDEGHFIMLVTARPQSHRQRTERALQEAGLYWDMLVMGLPKGTRVVINDSSKKLDIVAAGVEHVRNNEWREEDVVALLRLLDGRREVVLHD